MIKEKERDIKGMEKQKIKVILAMGLTIAALAGCGAGNNAAENKADMIESLSAVQTEDNTDKPAEETKQETKSEGRTESAEETAAESKSGSGAEAGTGAAKETKAEEAAESKAGSGEAKSETGAGNVEEKTYSDNFSVEAEDAEAFALKVKEIVEEKDLNALADLIAYPVYIRFPDEGISIEAKEDFTALGEEKIFTDELLASVLAADETSLPPSRAGFVLSGESGAPNIVFGVANGKLAVVSMNY